MNAYKRLSNDEKNIIDAHRQHNMSVIDIAKAIGRHHTTVSRYLRAKTRCTVPKKVGRPAQLDNRTKRIIVKRALLQQQSASTIRRELRLSVSTRRVQQILKTHQFTEYIKRLKSPALTDEHKKRRVLWAKDKLMWDKSDWTSVVFSDEKKFNLDGPDGTQYYWHDIRKENEVYSQRVQGGRSVMVWGAICFNGKLDLVGIDGKMDSNYYVEVLQSVLIPSADALLGDEWVFQQDNAAVHSSHVTREFLEANDVEVLDWPAKSPDLNIIENMWGQLVRVVYASGRQYNNVCDLQDAIMAAWNSIDIHYIRNLYRSIPTRLVSVVENHGKMTTY